MLKVFKPYFRFTIGKNGSLYAFCMTVPASGEQLKVKSLGSMLDNLDKPLNSVRLLGYDGALKWEQKDDGLFITCPQEMPFSTAVVFEIN